jgi:hypothetical protein
VHPREPLFTLGSETTDDETRRPRLVREPASSTSASLARAPKAHAGSSSTTSTRRLVSAFIAASMSCDRDGVVGRDTTSRHQRSGAPSDTASAVHSRLARHRRPLGAAMTWHMAVSVWRSELRTWFEPIARSAQCRRTRTTASARGRTQASLPGSAALHHS